MAIRSERPAPLPDDRGRVLVVDDNDLVRRGYARLLRREGYVVVEACDGRQATAAILDSRFDAVVSDVSMPEIDGVELLRTLRARDVGVPVILVTGEATVESAAAAVEHGALRYLLKPVDSDRLKTEVARAIVLGRVARLQREAAAVASVPPGRTKDRVAAELAFPRALKGLWMAFQPILGSTSHGIVAYEALVRTDERAFPHPGELFAAAESLQRLHELGRNIRAAVAEAITAGAPANIDVYVNLHSADLSDPLLYAADAPLSAHASRVVLEVTERAPLGHQVDIQARVRDLRSLGYRIAIDDLGAGYATLSWFTVLTPDVAKLDMSLVRGVDGDPIKRRLVRAMVELCKDLGITVVAEGVESVAERDVVVELGCHLVQGYAFARPGRGFPTASW